MPGANTNRDKTKLFPRGGTVVSKSQKNSKIMKKVRKQAGKKPDLFGEKKIAKSISTKPKVKKTAEEKEMEETHVDVSDNEDDDVPKFALNITTKVATKTAKAFCFIRSIDEMGIAVCYPGNGSTGYIKIDQISNKINEDLKGGKDVNLTDFYKVGESVLTSLSSKRKRNKLQLSMRPEHINQHIRVSKISEGQTVQGTFSSEEDLGWIVDLGFEGSKGFVPTEALKDVTMVVPGKTMMFFVKEILLEGRQIILTRENKALEDLNTFETLLPGSIVTFGVKTENKTGKIGKVFGLNATMHFTQGTKEPITDKNSEILARVIYLDIENKKLCLASTENFMNGNAEAPIDRDGEKIAAKIKETTGSGLMLEFGKHIGWCPKYNITEEKHDDTLSHYPAGKNVTARIIGYMIGEGIHLVTMRESVVESEFFRYDSFSATQMVNAKILKISNGWVSVSLAPHLFGRIPPHHINNTMPSAEYMDTKFKIGGNARLMVLDKTSDELYLSAKPNLMKSKLKRLVDMDDIEVNDISMGVITTIQENCIFVQFFNNIKAFVPIRELSLEFVKTIKENYTVGQLVRVRCVSIDPERDNQFQGSFILDPSLKKEKSTRVKTTGEAGQIVNSFTFDQNDQPAATGIPSLTGLTETGQECIIYQTDLSMDPSLCEAFFHQLSQTGRPLNGSFVESILRDGKFRLSAVKLTAEAAGSQHLYRIGHKFESMESGKLMIGTVVKVLDYGFQLQFGGRLRGLLHRAQCVDRFVPDHNKCFQLGETCLVRVTEIDAEKQRFLLTTKESELEQNALPDIFKLSNIFKCYVKEINEFAQYANLPFKFGDTLECTFLIKCEYERDTKKFMAQVEVNGVPAGITAIICGDGLLGDTIKAKFIGVHSKTELLFCPAELKESKEKRLIYSNRFLTAVNASGKLCLMSSRNGLLAQTLNIKPGAKVDVLPLEDIDCVSFGYLKSMTGKNGKVKWGVLATKDLSVGEIVDGIIYSVTAKGIRISIGSDVIVHCYFGGITPCFIPADKTLTICQKYFPKGKKIRVRVQNMDKNKAKVVMAEDYIDAEAEGLSMSKKRKAEFEKLENKVEKKVLKIDIQPKKEVKKEVVQKEIGLEDAADMDIEFGTVEEELEKRASRIVKDIVEVAPKKALTLEESEETARVAERELESAKLPEDVSGWERAVIAAPNNSEIWLRYSTFHITSGEIEKSRLIMDRALKKIHFREESDRLNIWRGRLNLESLYGDDDSLESQFNEAKKCNDEQKVYSALIEIQMESQKFSPACSLLRDAVKKFSNNIEFWVQLGRCQMELGEKHKSKVTLERALQAHKAKDHVLIIQRFSRLEFELGDCDRGKTILEQTLKVHPKRADIWGAYSDMLLKYSSVEEGRKVLERGIDLCSKSRGRIHLMKRMITLETRNGNDEGAQEWKTKMETEFSKKSVVEKIEE